MDGRHLRAITASIDTAAILNQLGIPPQIQWPLLGASPTLFSLFHRHRHFHWIALIRLCRFSFQCASSKPVNTLLDLPRAVSDAIDSFCFSRHRVPTKNIPTIPGAGPRARKSVADDLKAVLRKIAGFLGSDGAVHSISVTVTHCSRAVSPCRNRPVPERPCPACDK